MVDYNAYAKTFSDSRKNMKWEEISYFLEGLEGPHSNPLLKGEGITALRILDIGCGSGRLLGVLKEAGIMSENYLGLDLSQGLLDEAEKNYPGYNFKQANMLELDSIEEDFDLMFFIASFHHLDNLDDRKTVLTQAYSKLQTGGEIYMTNWALDSELNKEKYLKSRIEGSENEFGSSDYSIKIGEYTRYYHCFNTTELEYLFRETGFKIIENRLFNNNRNIISRIKKI